MRVLSNGIIYETSVAVCSIQAIYRDVKFKIVSQSLLISSVHTFIHDGDGDGDGKGPFDTKGYSLRLRSN